MRVVRVHEPGGPEALRLDELPRPEPGAGQARVRVAAAGVNFVDVYHRTGYYQMALPTPIGIEGAGVVEELGPGVTELAIGDRVAWVLAQGSYATHVVAPVERLVPLPERLGFEEGAAALEHGMTAHYLTHSTYAVQPGDTVLVHAGAGGVGRLLCQFAKRRGARVLATVSSEAKAAVAREAGADEVVRYDERDFAAEARRLTGGRGCDVVYDGVGRATFMKGLDCLRPRGMLVFFGQASGAVEPIHPLVLMQKGSLYLTRPSLAHYTLTREEYERRAREVLEAVVAGALRLRIDRALPLAEAAAAHRALEARETMGKVLLIPR